MHWTLECDCIHEQKIIQIVLDLSPLIDVILNYTFTVFGFIVYTNSAGHDSELKWEKLIKFYESRIHFN